MQTSVKQILESYDHHAALAERLGELTYSQGLRTRILGDLGQYTQ